MATHASDAQPQPSSGEFGALVRRMRTHRGMSQHEVALTCGLAPPYLCAVERNKRPAPEEHVVVKLAAALSLDTNETQSLKAEASRSRHLWFAQKSHERQAPLSQTKPNEQALPELSGVLREAERVAGQGRFRVVITVEPVSDTRAGHSTPQAQASATATDHP